MVLRVVDWLIDLSKKEKEYSFRLPSFFKLRHFEFWNTHLFHLPIYVYWLYLSLKARSLFFFSASNPGIETGGMLGESKIRIMQKIDSRLLPRSVFYSSVPTALKVLEDISIEEISFPFIVKPDVGQGGWLVEKIHDLHELRSFLSKIRMPFLVQEFVDTPIEIGLLYYRLPGTSNGKISSIAVKELLNVTGDGRSSLIQLIQNHPRAVKQLPKLFKTKKLDLNYIPAFGEKVVLSFMANHSFGTTFRNFNHIADENLTSIFDEFCNRIDGFFFGRFDLRCNSIEDLKKGNFKILELNGAGSEPLHIFDPLEKISSAYKSALEHWRIIYRISQMNRKAGVQFMKLKDALGVLRNVQRIQQMHKTNFTIGN